MPRPRTWCVSDLSLACEGGMLGLVGPNGAGKTTLMRIIATLLPPTTGSVRWNGLDAGSGGHQIRARLGYLPQQFGVYPEFSARRFLRYL
ncbi:MAG TPA: ATP-binding cassette domain-containing protein, partial [Candidatus Dormibacteraeota bacterium]